MRTRLCVILLMLAAALGAVAFFTFSVKSAHGETLSELQQAIEAKNHEIKRLEGEAAQFRAEIATRQETAKTLKGELARVDRAIVQLQRDIALTSGRARKKELEIQELGIEISDQEARIATLQKGIGAALRVLAAHDEEPLLAVMLKHQRISDFLGAADELSTLQDKALSSITELREIKKELAGQQKDAEDKKRELRDLETTLADRRAIQEGEKRARSQLLASTKNQ